MGIKKILYGSYVIGNLVTAIYFVVYTIFFSGYDPIDFPIFCGAARNALHGLSIYTITAYTIYLSGIFRGQVGYSFL